MKYSHLASAFILAATACCATAAEDAYPTKPLRIIVPYAPGGATDIVARQLSITLANKVGQPVVVDNRPGGASAVAVQAMSSAPVDGHTLGIFDPSTVAMNQYLFRKPPYNATRSLAPVAMLARNAMAIMVPAGSPPNDLQEFVRYARARPGMDFGSPGAGNAAHLAMEIFERRAGLQMTHIPYRGGAPVMQALVGGQVSVVVSEQLSAMPFIHAGQVKAIAVTGERRSPLLPTVPTIAESGYPGFDVTNWMGIFVAASTPKARVARLESALGEVMADPAFQAKLKELGLDQSFHGSGELTEEIRKDSEKYGSIIRQINLSLD